MREKNKKSLYSGTLLSLTQNIDEFDGIVALRMHRKGRSYPAVLYRNACYSQFEANCVGQKIVWAREVTKEEVEAEHPHAWRIYTNSRSITEELSMPLVEMMDNFPVLVLHRMDDRREFLVQAERVEILKNPPKQMERWEATVPPITEEIWD